jgi:hypothetical protein
MHQKRVTFGRVQEFWWGASRTHRKRTFVADSPDSGLVYPHKVGLLAIYVTGIGSVPFSMKAHASPLILGATA